jgi:serine/threonine-protein kinase
MSGSVTPAEKSIEWGEARSRIGQTIADVGTIKGILGLGGMAAVYRVERSDGSACAMKLLHEREARSDHARARFIREYEFLAAVDHPCSPQAFSIGQTEDGLQYFTMELLQGWTLHDILLQRGDPFDPLLALQIVQHVLGVLKAYHTEGIVHLDIKPTNLLLTRTDRRVELVDYGCAEYIDELKGATEMEVLGTSVYMAPEHARGEWGKVDARADIFSLGATCFELLTGQPPRPNRGLDGGELDNIPPVREVAPDIDTSVADVVDRAVSEDLEERWASAGEMYAVVSGLIATLGGADAGETAPGDTLASAETTFPGTDASVETMPGPVDALIPSECRDSLVAAYQREEDQWRNRSALMAARLWMRANWRDETRFAARLVGETAEALLQNGRREELVDWVWTGFRYLEDEELRSRFVGEALGDRRFERLIATGPNADADVVEGRADRLRRLAEALPERETRSLFRAFVRGESATRDLLKGAMIPRVGRKRRLVRQAVNSGHPEASAAILSMLEAADTVWVDNLLRDFVDADHAIVRRAAARTWVVRAARQAGMSPRALLERRLASDQVSERLFALKVIKATGESHYASILTDRIEDVEFDDLPVSERRHLLRALAEVAADQAEATVQRLVRTEGMFGRGRHETTQMMVVRLLGDIGETVESLERLEELQRGSWFGSSDVQAAAREAAGRVRERLEASTTTS